MTQNITGTGHRIEPVKDSWYTEGKSLPANILNAYDYPIIAVCAICGGRIRAQNKLADWEHVGQ